MIHGRVGRLPSILFVKPSGVPRFLKMELELRNPGTKTFIDCDDLTDLTRLFSYVGQDSRG